MQAPHPSAHERTSDIVGREEEHSLPLFQSGAVHDPRLHKRGIVAQLGTLAWQRHHETLCWTARVHRRTQRCGCGLQNTERRQHRADVRNDHPHCLYAGQRQLGDRFCHCGNGTARLEGIGKPRFEHGGGVCRFLLTDDLVPSCGFLSCLALFGFRQQGRAIRDCLVMQARWVTASIRFPEFCRAPWT